MVILQINFFIVSLELFTDSHWSGIESSRIFLCHMTVKIDHIGAFIMKQINGNAVIIGKCVRKELPAGALKICMGFISEYGIGIDWKP